MAESPDSLKAAGNAHFSAGRLPEAVAAYRAALDLSPESQLQALLHSNLAAVHLAQHDWDSALSAARASIALDASLTKAHFRAGVALTALERPIDAIASLGVAARLDPKNSAVLSALADAEALRLKSIASGPITSLEDFIAAFRACKDVRVRLATLATFWNALGAEARWATFARLLELLLGPDAVTNPPPPAYAGPHISHFDQAQLAPLPMANYVDVSVPSTWVAFFDALQGGGAAAQVGALEAVWAHCDATEQRLIIADMQSFFRRPSAPDADAEADDAGADADPLLEHCVVSGAPLSGAAEPLPLPAPPGYAAVSASPEDGDSEPSS